MLEDAPSSRVKQTARKRVGGEAASPAVFAVWHPALTRAAEEGGVVLLGQAVAAQQYVDGRVVYRVARGAEGPRKVRLALHVQKRDTYRSSGLNSAPFAPLHVPACSPYSKTMRRGGGRALQAIWQPTSG